MCLCCAELPDRLLTRPPACFVNHLPARSFLFTGLLLQMDPEGITQNRLVFSVLVGALTTSIVAFTGYVFIRELFWQVMAALFEIDDEEAAEDELESELADEEAAHAALDGDHHLAVVSAPHSPAGGMSEAEGEEQGDGEQQQRPSVWEEAGGATAAAPADGTPPPPGWVSRLAPDGDGGS
jgi:hypothetical protein